MGKPQGAAKDWLLTNHIKMLIRASVTIMTQIRKDHQLGELGAPHPHRNPLRTCRSDSGQLIKQERAKKGMKIPEDLTNVNKETVEQFNVKINEDAFGEILKTKNACIDLTQYNEDDYIVPLTQKHHEQGQR